MREIGKKRAKEQSAGRLRFYFDVERGCSLRTGGFRPNPRPPHITPHGLNLTFIKKRTWRWLRLALHS